MRFFPREARPGHAVSFAGMFSAPDPRAEQPRQSKARSRRQGQEFTGELPRTNLSAQPEQPGFTLSCGGTRLAAFAKAFRFPWCPALFSGRKSGVVAPSQSPFHLPSGALVALRAANKKRRKWRRGQEGWSRHFARSADNTIRVAASVWCYGRGRGNDEVYEPLMTPCKARLRLIKRWQRALNARAPVGVFWSFPCGSTKGHQRICHL